MRTLIRPGYVGEFIITPRTDSSICGQHRVRVVMGRMTHPGTAVAEPLSGLTADQVAERTAAGQVNDVPAKTSRSLSEIVRSNVLTPFNAIIGTLFVIELAVAPIQDALFGFVIVANSAIGILQVWRAKQTLDSLAVVGEARPRVLRDG